MPRPRSELPQRIVDAARERFLEQGVDGASLRGIAQDAGTSIGMVYYYFPTKDELFAAVVEDVYAGALDELRAALSEPTPIERRIEALYARLARMDTREIAVARLVLREALISSDRLRRVASRFGRGHVPLMLAALSQATTEGRIDATLHPVVVAIATGLLGMMPQVAHHVVSAAQLPVASLLPARADAAEQLARVVLFGVAGEALREAQRVDPRVSSARARRPLRRERAAGKRRTRTR